MALESDNSEKIGTVYCDFDGTLIHEDSEKLYLEYLMKNKEIRWYQFLLAGISVPISAIRKRFYRGTVLKSWTAGMEQNELDLKIKRFLEDNGKKIHVNYNVCNIIAELKEKYRIVVLTGSLGKIVEECLNYFGLSDMFDAVIGTEVGWGGIFVRRHPYGKDKCRYIDTSEKTVGIANEFSDYFYLNSCERVYVVKGDDRLTAIAKRNLWEVI